MLAVGRVWTSVKTFIMVRNFIFCVFVLGQLTQGGRMQGSLKYIHFEKCEYKYKYKIQKLLEPQYKIQIQNTLRNFSEYKIQNEMYSFQYIFVLFEKKSWILAVTLQSKRILYALLPGKFVRGAKGYYKEERLREWSS